MIRFSYIPTLNDYRLLNRYAMRAVSKWIPFAITLCIIFCFLLVSRMFSTTPFELKAMAAATPLVIPGVFAIFLTIFMHSAAKTRWDSAKDIREVKQYAIDGLGIRIDGSSFSGFAEWQHISEADLYKSLFIIKTFQNQFDYFPVDSVPEKQQFVELAKQKVKTSKEFNEA